MNIKKITNSNYTIIVIVIIIGLTFGLPYILIPRLQGDQYDYTPFVVNGINALTVDETGLASKTRDVYDGHLIVRDSQLFEHKNAPNIFHTFPYLVLGCLSHLLGFESTFIICHFICPAMIFLLIYILMFKMTNDKYISILGGVALLYGCHLLNYLPPITPSLFKNLIYNIISTDMIRPLHYFARLPFIQFTFIELILALIFLYFAIKENKYRYSIISGVFGGLLFYSYLFHWTFFFVGCGFLFLIFLSKRDYKESKQILIAISVSLLLSILFWINFVNFKMLPYHADLLSRNGLYIGRWILHNVIMSCKYLVFLALFSILIKRKRKDETFYFLISFLLGGIACLNAQVILGYTIQPYHWVATGIDPLVVIMLCYLIYQILNTTYREKRLNDVLLAVKKNHKPLCIILILLFSAYGAYYHTMYSLNTYKYYTLPETTVDAFNWLDENTKVDDVVLSCSIENICLIPVHTHNNNFIPWERYSSASTDEILDRIYIAYKLFNVSPSYLEELMNQDNAVIDDYYIPFRETKVPNKDLFEKAFWNPIFFGRKFYITPYYLADAYDYPKDIKEKIAKGGLYYIPLEVREEISEDYENCMNKDTVGLLYKYRIDYIYYGPYEKKISNANLSQYTFLEEVYRNEDVIIYEVKTK